MADKKYRIAWIETHHYTHSANVTASDLAAILGLPTESVRAALSALGGRTDKQGRDIVTSIETLGGIGPDGARPFTDARTLADALSEIEGDDTLDFDDGPYRMDFEITEL